MRRANWTEYGSGERFMAVTGCESATRLNRARVSVGRPRQKEYGRLWRRETNEKLETESNLPQPDFEDRTGRTGPTKFRFYPEFSSLF